MTLIIVPNWPVVNSRIVYCWGRINKNHCMQKLAWGLLLLSFQRGVFVHTLFVSAAVMTSWQLNWYSTSSYCEWNEHFYPLWTCFFNVKPQARQKWPGAWTQFDPGLCILHVLLICFDSVTRCIHSAESRPGLDHLPVAWIHGRLWIVCWRVWRRELMK